jgi:hypothetical protein
MMLEGRFPIESQVGLSGVIASNTVKLAKVNFVGITGCFMAGAALMGGH